MVTVSKQLPVTCVYFGCLDQGYIFSISNCLHSLLTILLRNCGALGIQEPYRWVHCLKVSIHFFPSTYILLISFFKAWLSSELISRKTCFLSPYYLLLKPLKAMWKAREKERERKKKKKKKTSAQLSLSQQWLYFEYFVQKDIFTQHLVGKQIRPLDVPAVKVVWFWIKST